MLVTIRFSIYDANECIYNKFEDDTYAVICLYVDDMLILGTSLKVICKTKKFLEPKFEMKDLRETLVII